ncbi:MAG: hypothetical protein HWE25_14300 [Alphaproteobacteria bacterium]|nr:hypothetical protein [Alphaproteobacteria bacterium]
MLAPLKSFLQSNKIYLETFSFVLVGGMSIIVSYQANQIGRSQVALNHQQLRLSEQSIAAQKESYLPVIDAQIKLLSGSGNRRQEQLEIRASKHPVFDVAVDVVGAVKIERRKDGVEPVHATKGATSYKASIEEIADIPVQFISGGIIEKENKYEGLILTSPVDANIRTDVKAALEAAYRDETTSFYVEMEKILRVAFTDNSGNRHVKFFRFDFGGQGIPARGPIVEGRFRELYEAAVRRDNLFVSSDAPNEVVNAWLAHKRRSVEKQKSTSGAT